MNFTGVVSKMAELVKQDKKKIVLPESEDARVLKAASIVANEGFADIVLIGKEDEILKKCNEENIDFPKSKILLHQKKIIMIICYMNLEKLRE